MEAAGLAARISHRNQGRQRQEGLVARRLREASDAGEANLEQLQVCGGWLSCRQGLAREGKAAR